MYELLQINRLSLKVPKSMVLVRDIDINFEIQGTLIVFMIPKTCTLGHFY